MFCIDSNAKDILLQQIELLVFTEYTIFVAIDNSEMIFSISLSIIFAPVDIF